ncbi:PPP4R2-domain-containing protein [Infundibulicybe gibba]|nr:PPP4R2-domain-containing protein [Infundibulicybe gibba]
MPSNTRSHSIVLGRYSSSCPTPDFRSNSVAIGGLKLPPFPPRKLAHMHMNEAPMTKEQALELKGYIFQQLHEFESNPPFTIQRVCELCLRPKQHYRMVGKYLRAVEKSLLVTSTWDSFPALPDAETDPSGRSLTFGSTDRQSVPATPLFSPIPFLHDDARRSKSRSPPPSPLALASSGPGVGIHSDPLEARALGLVDELDDPSPGHMSDHPTALTAVTTTSDGKGSRPFLGSLTQRFVKAEGEAAKIDEQRPDDEMVVDDDKENNHS